MLNYPMETDNYGYLTFHTPELDEPCSTEFSLSFVYPYDYIPLRCCDFSKKTKQVKLEKEFFESSCKMNNDGTRSLILDGKDIYQKIGRRIENSDVPILLIFLAQNQDIIKLDLRNNELVSSAGFMNIFEYMINNDHLIELNVKNNRLCHISVNYFSHYQDKLKLQTLNLRGNIIGVENSKRLALAIAKNTTLKHLDVAELHFDTTCLTYFITSFRTDQIHCNQTLKGLNLSRPTTECIYSKFNSRHVAEILGPMLQLNTSLEELYLQKFHFTCHDMEAMIMSSKYNETLKVLDLSCNNIGDHGAEFLTEWLKMRTSLQFLLLGKNIITNIGIKALSRSIPFSNLLMLDVSNNRFGDEGGTELFYSFQKYPHIQHIRIFGNDLGHETAKIVKRLLSSKTFDQKNIDVKVYELDEVLQFAYYEPESWHSTKI